MERVARSNKYVSAIEVHRRPLVFGVVALIFDPEGRLFVIEEKTGKDETVRTAGEIGVPCETSEKNELFWDTYKRGLKQELGIDDSNCSALISRENMCGFKPFIPGRVFAFVISAVCSDPAALEKSCRDKGDGEVIFYGWLTPGDLLKKPNLRPGVRNILSGIFPNK